MNMLVVTDLTDAASAVVQEARAWATRLGARVWLIHVAEPDPDFLGYEPGPQTVRDSVARRFHVEHRQIEETARKLRDEGLDATALLVQGPTAETITREARKLKADLIVMGAGSHGMLHDLLLGSVTKQVTHKAPCPVLVVPVADAS